MKKFKYNLQRILDLKKIHEEECKMALGLAISILAEIENRIKETASRQYNAAIERFKDPTQIMIWNNYIERLEQETEKLMEEAAQAELVVEEKRAIYMEAFSEVKALEKVKEKREEEYIKQMTKKESDEIDEVFASRQNRAIFL